MPNRKTAESKIVEYETAECIHCEDEVFIDEEMENIDSLPEGINVVIGSGDHIKLKTSRGTRHRTPRIITKWFSSEGKNVHIKRQYMCRPCARAVYGFNE